MNFSVYVIRFEETIEIFIQKLHEVERFQDEAFNEQKL